MRRNGPSQSRSPYCRPASSKTNGSSGNCVDLLACPRRACPAGAKVRRLSEAGLAPSFSAAPPARRGGGERDRRPPAGSRRTRFTGGASPPGSPDAATDLSSCRMNQTNCPLYRNSLRPQGLARPDPWGPKRSAPHEDRLDRRVRGRTLLCNPLRQGGKQSCNPPETTAATPLSRNGHRTCRLDEPVRRRNESDHTIAHPLELAGTRRRLGIDAKRLASHAHQPDSARGWHRQPACDDGHRQAPYAAGTAAANRPPEGRSLKWRRPEGPPLLTSAANRVPAHRM